MENILKIFHNTNKKLHIFKKKKGFTIIELIVVIAIIGILLGISTLVANKIIRRERVISETDRLVSILKEAQKYSMINSFYKDADGIIQKRHYGVRISKANNVYRNNNENDFSISLVWKKLKSNDYAEEVVDKTHNISEIKIYKVPANNKEPQLVDDERVYFNDTALTSDNKTLRITDTVDEYKRDIVISQMGHINVESPK